MKSNVKGSLLLGAAAMVCTSPVFSLAIDDNVKVPVLWPEGVVPYYVQVIRTNWFTGLFSTFNNISSPEAEQQLRNAVVAGVAQWNSVESGAHLKFIEIDPADASAYPAALSINLRGTSKITDCGASAGIGFPGAGKTNTLSLPEGCPSSISHELGHVLGFEHEHSRHDANLVLNKCNHKAATADSCSNLTTNGWASQTGKKAMTYVSDYDPFSVMHYSLQNNIKPELKDQIDPLTGYYYTTIDFSRDPAKSNHLVELVQRLGQTDDYYGLTEAGLYEGVRDRHASYALQLSPTDREFARDIYTPGWVDTQMGLSVSCFSKDAPSGDCLVPGEFKIVASASNLGAWPAEGVVVTTSLPANVDRASLVWDGGDGVVCNINTGNTELVCQMDSLAAQEIRKISVGGILTNPALRVSLSSTITTTSEQNPYLFTSAQDRNAAVNVGG